MIKRVAIGVINKAAWRQKRRKSIESPEQKSCRSWPRSVAIVSAFLLTCLSKISRPPDVRLGSAVSASRFPIKPSGHPDIRGARPTYS